jgi:hypothetical protein
MRRFAAFPSPGSALPASLQKFGIIKEKDRNEAEKSRPARPKNVNLSRI